MYKVLGKRTMYMFPALPLYANTDTSHTPNWTKALNKHGATKIRAKQRHLSVFIKGAKENV